MGNKDRELNIRALMLQFEILREERSAIESRELQVVSLILSSVIVIFTIGFEVDIWELFLIMPIVYFLGYFVYAWTGVNYEAKDVMIKKVESELGDLKVVNVFGLENRLQDFMRGKVRGTFSVPILGLAAVIMAFSILLAVSRVLLYPSSEPSLVLIGILYLCLLFLALLLRKKTTREFRHQVDVIRTEDDESRRR